MDLGNLSSEMPGNGLARRDLTIYQLSYVLPGLEVRLKGEFCCFPIMSTFVFTIHDFYMKFPLSSYTAVGSQTFPHIAYRRTQSPQQPHSNRSFH